MLAAHFGYLAFLSMMYIMRHTPLGKLFKEESVQCCSGRADLKKCRPLPDMKGTVYSMISSTACIRSSPFI